MGPVTALDVGPRQVGARTKEIQALHEPYAHLYVGDYFADTLDLSAHEHCALRLLLLETWVRGPVGNARLRGCRERARLELGQRHLIIPRVSQTN